jgi:hypothetical protein
MRAVGRILAITAAYLASCYVAGAVFFAVLFNPVFMPEVGLGETLYVVLFAGLAAGAVAAVFALVPTALLIAYAEAANRRSRRFYALPGALIGPISFIAFLLTIGRGPGFSDTTWSVLVLLVASMLGGIAAALAYWALAGRNAGAWRRAAAGSETTLPARS